MVNELAQANYTSKNKAIGSCSERYAAREMKSRKLA
jgi:hypothetical protein